MVKQIRKILTIVSILPIVAIAGILITALFGVNIFTGTILKILLSCAVLAVVSTFSISALSYYNKKKVLSIVNIVMLVTLGIMVFIIIWLNKFGVFSKITITLAIATGLVGIMNSNIIQLGKRYKGFQIFSILLIVVADVMLTLTVWGAYPFANFHLLRLFIITMIVAFVDICILSILARKARGENTVEENKQQTLVAVTANSDEIVIKKSEYEAMQQRIRELENEVNALKIKNLENQVEMLKSNNANNENKE